MFDYFNAVLTPSLFKIARESVSTKCRYANENNDVINSRQRRARILQDGIIVRTEVKLGGPANKLNTLQGPIYHVKRVRRSPVSKPKVVCKSCVNLLLAFACAESHVQVYLLLDSRDQCDRWGRYKHRYDRLRAQYTDRYS